jgi:hypothetical protein
MPVLTLATSIQRVVPFSNNHKNIPPDSMAYDRQQNTVLLVAVPIPRIRRHLAKLVISCRPCPQEIAQLGQPAQCNVLEHIVHAQVPPPGCLASRSLCQSNSRWPILPTMLKKNGAFICYPAVGFDCLGHCRQDQEGRRRRRHHLGSNHQVAEVC